MAKMGVKVGEVIQYLGDSYEVVDVYSYIAYLKNLRTSVTICVGIGDMVMSGLIGKIKGLGPTPLPTVPNPAVKKTRAKEAATV